jgi:hypothetical protein
MESFVRNGASDYVAGCRVAQQSREYARKAGSFHQYFVATFNLITGLVHRGKLGEAIQTAREGSELAATDPALAKSIATRSIQLAQEHRACGYEARGYRLLSEIASQEGDDDGALELISAGMEALEGYEIRNEEWQIYASASRALAVRGRLRESEQARAHAFEVGGRIAATLAEPTLQRSLLARIEAQAPLRRTA